MKLKLGLNPGEWDRPLRNFFYQLTVELMTFALSEVEPTSEESSDGKDTPTDDNEKSENKLKATTGLSKVKEKTNARVKVTKMEVEIFKHVTKYVTLKNKYMSPLGVSVIGIKDTRVVGVRLSLFSADTLLELTAFLPLTKTSHPDFDEKKDIKDFITYFVQKDPNFVLRFCIFNRKSFVLKRSKDSSDVFQLDLWKSIPLEMLLQWDFLLPIKSSAKKESTVPKLP